MACFGDVVFEDGSVPEGHLDFDGSDGAHLGTIVDVSKSTPG